jgi:hemoglobin-like flavoprotein
VNRKKLICKITRNFQKALKIYPKVSKTAFQQKNYEQTAYLSHSVKNYVENVENYDDLPLLKEDFLLFPQCHCGKC